jgi:hypothetical protein
MLNLYVYVFNSFKSCPYEFVFTYRINCHSSTIAQRRARALEKCLNTNSIDRYVVLLSKIREGLIFDEDIKLPF